MINLPEQFKHPDNQFRGMPFWSWNGQLEEDELLRQIQVIKEMGFGGFFMHSRTGLATEYLGEEWFNLINACADEAAKIGMEAWLYDEDRWPSGTAGGMVTEIPEYRMKYLRMDIMRQNEFIWNDKIIAAFSCRLDDVNFTDCVRIQPEQKDVTSEDKTILFFTLEEMEKNSFYNGNTYIDTLNLDATNYFIKLTHEKYKQKCGKSLGKSIRGIFTDEPHRGAVMNGFGITNRESHRMIPWTYHLPEYYENRFGEDIMDVLPDIFLCRNGEAVSPVKWRYMETLQQMFLDNFVRPLYQWCEENHIQLTGHALHEDSLTCQAAMQGSLMRFYEYQHVPGVDVLTEGNRNYSIVKQLASAARQTGRHRMLSELYGCTGWQMNFASHKSVGDWQALYGINLRCHHLSWYSMEGEAKRDFPASILHQSAWWKDYSFVETYFARLGLILSQGKPCCDTLMLNPVESVWSQIRVGWASGLTPLLPEIMKIEDQYSQLSVTLLKNHIDFDYGDEDMLDRLLSIEINEQQVPVLKIGHAAYKTVIIAGMTTIRSSTMKILQMFRDQGGKLIFIGDSPAYIDAVSSQKPSELARASRHIRWDWPQIIGEISKSIEYPIRITNNQTGCEDPDILCQLRKENDNFFLAAVNSDSQTSQHLVTITLPSAATVEEWDCVSGERYAVPFIEENGHVLINAEFAPSQSRIYALTNRTSESLPSLKNNQTSHITACSSPWKYSMTEENICVLDIAKYHIDEQAWEPAQEILHIDRAIRSNLGLPYRGGEMIQPWRQKQLNASPKAITDITLAFDFQVDKIPESMLVLCLERPELWKIQINDIDIPCNDAGQWLDIAFRKIPFTPQLLKHGTNRILLKTGFHQGINLEAIYLLGDFGVRVDGSKIALIEKPIYLSSQSITDQGFPFYSGGVKYHIPLPEETPAHCPVIFHIPHFEGACIKVYQPETDPIIIGWPPYSVSLTDASIRAGWLEVEIILTRRNTFGPLHQLPMITSGYGPDNFITEGNAFSLNPVFYPAGILSPPEIRW
jgi:hypothetical protein